MVAGSCDLGTNRPPPRAATIRLVAHGWESHSVATSLISVLLASALSYNVERERITTGADTFDALARGRVHVDAEAWPGSQASAYEEYVVRRASVASAGPIGYSGRSGLYATEALLRGDDCDTWRALRRASVISRLPTVDELGESDTPVHTGEYAACAGPPSRPPSAREPGPCAALVHVSHAYDRDLVEALTDGLRLNLSVWYAGTVGAHEGLVRDAAEWGGPMLAYAYRPSTLLATLNATSLRRLSLPEEARVCAHRLSADNGRRLECDFPSQALLTLHTRALARTHPTAERLLRAVSVPADAVDEMLGWLHARDLGRPGGGGAPSQAEAAAAAAAEAEEDEYAWPDAVACAWLREHREQWEPWVQAALGEDANAAATTALAAALVGLTLCACGCSFAYARASRRLRLARRMGVDANEALFGPAEGGARGKARRATRLAAFALGCAGPAALHADEPSPAPAGVAAAGGAERVDSVRGAGSAAQAQSEPQGEGAADGGGSARRFAISIVLIGAALGISVGTYGSLEGWSALDAVYFAIATLTTVGYGDLTPSTEAGRGFTIAFALASMGVLGFALVAFVSGLLEAQEAARRRVVHLSVRSMYRVRDSRALRRLSGAGAESSAEAAAHAAAAERLRAAEQAEAREQAEPETPAQFVRALLRLSQPLVVCLTGGVALGALVEGWSAVDSLYYAVITVTTIGFGDLSPQTLLGRALACAFLPLSVAGVAKAVQDIAQHASMQWTLRRTQDVEALLRTAGVAELNEADFLLHVVSQLYGVDPRVTSAIRAQFSRLDVDGSGTVDYGDVKVMLERQRAAREAARRACEQGGTSAAASEGGLLLGGLSPVAGSRGAGEGGGYAGLEMRGVLDETPPGLRSAEIWVGV